ncbi:hypothetical protein C8J55DRAFT_492006 [Lentinula edodes]|uniref:Uncharacterized protein n=1 Tax=Lentinula lateritia TaxID=40482 RepID=A0A9W8ZYQ2_9AGAR|nr:hypothetical protein C8J55DRAFT_492006 [Lentinula edodes]
MRASTVLFPSISLAVFLAITSLILPAAAILIPFKKSPKLPAIPSLSSGEFQILAYKDEQCNTRKSPLITVQHHFSEAQVYEAEYPTPKAKCALVQALPANCVLILYGKEDNNERNCLFALGTPPAAFVQDLGCGNALGSQRMIIEEVKC